MPWHKSAVAGICQQRTFFQREQGPKKGHNYFKVTFLGYSRSNIYEEHEGESLSRPSMYHTNAHETHCYSRLSFTSSGNPTSLLSDLSIYSTFITETFMPDSHEKPMVTVGIYLCVSCFKIQWWIILTPAHSYDEIRHQGYRISHSHHRVPARWPKRQNR